MLFVVCMEGMSQDTTRVSLLFMGDIMGHDTQISAAWNDSLKKYDYSDCFTLIVPIIDDADFPIANLEVSLAGPPYKGYPQFSSPDELADAIWDAGIKTLVTANNHCYDRHKQGMERTIDVLNKKGFAFTGSFKDSVDRQKRNVLRLEKDGIKLAILNYTYGTNGIQVKSPNIVNYIDTAVIRKDIIEARKLTPDKIIVFLHWGYEYQTTPHKHQLELNAFLKKQGVDIVIGSHPHVVQPVQWDKGEHFVVYSLGNFISNQRTAPRDGGVMVRLELAKVNNQTFVEDAGYYLTWVYAPRVNGDKSFHVIPVQPFEQEKLYPDATARKRMLEYGKEARAVFSNNKNVIEYKFNPDLPGWEK